MVPNSICQKCGEVIREDYLRRICYSFLPQPSEKIIILCKKDADVFDNMIDEWLKKKE